MCLQVLLTTSGVMPEKEGKQMAATTLLNTFKDASGLVTVGVYEARSASALGAHTDQAAHVPDDMIVVGGGACAEWTGYGALLTASYPDAHLSAWLASSKSHTKVDNHFFKTWAVGLKIEGITRQQLLEFIHVDRQESGMGTAPQASAYVPAGHVLLGGGIKIEWTGYGVLATASYPSSNRSWTAKSKSHTVEAQANLKCWAISLRKNLPVGTVDTVISNITSPSSFGPSASSDVPPGYALSGGGGEVRWTSFGNLLWRLQPSTETTNQDFAASGKSHTETDSSTVTAYAMGIKINP